MARVAPAPGSDILVKLGNAHLLQEIVARGRGMVRLTAHVKVNKAQLVLPRYQGVILHGNGERGSQTGYKSHRLF